MPPISDELVRAHLPAVWRLARALAGNDADAEDLVQETFLKAQRTGEPLRAAAATRTWLLTITANAARDAGRRHSTRQRHLRLAGVDRPVETGAAAAPEADAEARELESRALAAMSGLPPRPRAVLHLVAVEGLEVRDAAAVLGITAGNAASALSVGRQAVRTALTVTETTPTRQETAR